MQRVAYGLYEGRPCKVVAIRPCVKEGFSSDSSFKKIISIEFLDKNFKCRMDLLDEVFYNNFEPQDPFDILEMQEECNLLTGVDPHEETAQLNAEQSCRETL